jgi:hypothetical protein
VEIDPERQREGDGDHAPDSAAVRRTSRDVLYEEIAILLAGKGVLTPAAEFVADVRRAAGFRVSPREVAAALAQVAPGSRPVTANGIADIVSSLRGQRSARQQRHAADWRALGTQLALRDADGSPAGQRAFIGMARGVAGPRASDALLLQVALAISGMRVTLEPRIVGKVARRLASSARDLSREAVADQVRREVVAIDRDRTRGRSTPQRPAAIRSAHRDRTVERFNPGRRSWRPGGRRRRAVKRIDTSDNRE